MRLFDAEILAKELISTYVPHYSFGWMTEKRVNGRCYYDIKTIKLSRHLTPLRSDDAVRTTIMHEIAHALTKGDGHGRRWQMQMLRFGLAPSRCSQDSPDTRSISNWEARCPGCSQVYYMIRQPRIRKSCANCSGGRFNEKYVLTYRRI